MSLIATVIYTNMLLSLQNKKEEKKEFLEKEKKSILQNKKGEKKSILKNVSKTKVHNKTKHVSYQ